MHGKKCKLQPVRDSDLVINAAQVILYHLLLGSQPHPDLPILSAFRDQRHNLQFFWC